MRITANVIPPDSVWRRYGIGVALVAGVFTLQWLLYPVFGDQLVAGILFLAVLVAAWLGGFGPAVLVGFAGIAAIALLLPHKETDGDEGISGAIFFFLITIGIALLGSGMSRARRRAEVAAEKLRTTLSSIGDAVLVTDSDGRIVSLNPVAEKLTGWTTSEARGVKLEKVFVIVNEQTRAPAENPAARAMKDGVIVGLANHTLLITKDGRERPIDDSAAPIQSREGALLGCVLVFRDVTERRRAEEALRESEQRFAQLADNISQLAWMADEHGSIFWYNRRWFEYTATTLEEMRAQGWKNVLHPDHSKGVVERLNQCFETGQSWEDTFPLRSSDNTYRWFLCRAMPIRNSGGHINRWFGTCTDISEQRTTQEQLRDLAAQLSEADRRKDTFIATLAHELRNPLAPISTGLEIMRLSQDDPDQIEEVRSTLERQTQQLVTLVDDLLDVSRITRGKLQLRTCRVAMADVIRSAIEAARPAIDEANHELTMEIPEQPIYLDADPHRLAQVFSNLLNNAAKYTPEGGQISLTVATENDSVVVSVKDSGIGISHEQQNSIFEMFGQIEHPMQRAASGLGIGLTLVKSLVEMHAGRIEVCSAGANQGSEFVVRLPGLATAPGEASAIDSPDPQPVLRSRRVLIVDDNYAAAHMLNMAVKMLGNEVRVANDGQEAIEVAAEFMPEVILMDIGMPRLNGYEAADYIRRQPWGKKMILVALTGWGQDEDKRRTTEAGFDYHLVKPAEPSELQRLLAAPSNELR